MKKFILLLTVFFLILTGCSSPDGKDSGTIYFKDEPVQQAVITIRNNDGERERSQLTSEELKQYLSLREKLLNSQEQRKETIYGSPGTTMEITTDNKTYYDSIDSILGLMTCEEGYNYYSVNDEYFSYIRKLTGEKFSSEDDSGLFTSMPFTVLRQEDCYYYFVPNTARRKHITAIINSEVADYINKVPHVYNETTTIGDYQIICVSKDGHYLIVCPDKKEIDFRLRNAEYRCENNQLLIELDVDTPEKGTLRATMPIADQLTGEYGECEINGSGHYTITLPEKDGYQQLLQNDPYTIYNSMIYSFYQDGVLIRQDYARIKHDREIIDEIDKSLKPSMQKKIECVCTVADPFTIGIYNYFNQQIDGIWHYGLVLLIKPHLVMDYHIQAISLENDSLDMSGFNDKGKNLNYVWSSKEDCETLVYVCSFTSDKPATSHFKLKIRCNDKDIISDNLTDFGSKDDYFFYQDRNDLINGSYNDLFLYDQIEEKLYYDPAVPSVSTLGIMGNDWATEKLKGKSRQEVAALLGKPVISDNIYKGYYDTDQITVTYENDVVASVDYVFREKGTVSYRNGNDVGVNLKRSGKFVTVNMYHSDKTAEEKEKYQEKVNVIVSYHGNYEDMTIELDQ